MLDNFNTVVSNRKLEVHNGISQEASSKQHEILKAVERISQVILQLVSSPPGHQTYVPQGGQNPVKPSGQFSYHSDLFQPCRFSAHEPTLASARTAALFALQQLTHTNNEGLGELIVKTKDI